jgi:hypothetical protein
MIDGIKANENLEELEKQIKEDKQNIKNEESKMNVPQNIKSSDKSHSVIVTPHTVMQHGKRMYSPLARQPKMKTQ